MRRLALLSVATLVACTSETSSRDPAPLDRFFYPSGIAVLDHRLFVASSNADLTYDQNTGGSVIGVNVCDRVADPSCTDAVAGALNLRSFAGELAIADPTACPALGAAGASALVPIRGVDLVTRLDVGADGALSCAGGTSPGPCELAVGNSQRGDPWAVGIACDTAETPGAPSIARAFVGYLRESDAKAWLTQIDLKKSPADEGYVQHQVYDTGQIRGMAYDPTRRRVYFTRTVIGASSSLAYLDLANDCRIDVTPAEGGCLGGFTRPGAVPLGLELRGIALAHVTDPASRVRRAYVTARIYDPNASAAQSNRIGDFDGLFLVVDLEEDAGGVVDFRIVRQLSIGYGAGGVRVLPPRPGKRDVVAALAADDGVLWIYDDETGATAAIGRDPATGAPLTGSGPFAIAADPAVLPGTAVNGSAGTARVYVGSFREHFVTAIDVPLDAPETTADLFAGGRPRRISGGIP